MIKSDIFFHPLEMVTLTIQKALLQLTLKYSQPDILDIQIDLPLSSVFQHSKSNPHLQDIEKGEKVKKGGIFMYLIFGIIFR